MPAVGGKIFSYGISLLLWYNQKELPFTIPSVKVAAVRRLESEKKRLGRHKASHAQPPKSTKSRHKKSACFLLTTLLRLLHGIPRPVADEQRRGKGNALASGLQLATRVG